MRQLHDMPFVSGLIADNMMLILYKYKYTHDAEGTF